MPTRHHRADSFEPAPAPPQNWLTQLGGNVPMTFVISGLVAVAVWYGTSNSKQAQYDSEIVSLKAKVEQGVTTNAARLNDEATQRTAVRNEFLANQSKTTEILSQISSRLAVSETKQEATNKALDTTNQTLTKIADQLQQLNSRSGAVGR